MVLFYDNETYRGLVGLNAENFSYPSQWSSFVQKTKDLYRDSLYKRCASQCEKMLQGQTGKLHPLHETFLYFHIAICYESLGLVAHKFSTKKLSLLNLAKDAFATALTRLPKPSEISCPHPRSYGDPEVYKGIDKAQVDEAETQTSSSIVLKTWIRKRSDEHCDSGYNSESDSLTVRTKRQGSGSSKYSVNEPLAALFVQIENGNQASHHQELLNDDAVSLNLGNGADKLIPKPLFIGKRLLSPQSGLPAPQSVTIPAMAARACTSKQLKPGLATTSPPKISPPSHSPSYDDLIPNSTHNTNLSAFHTILTKHLCSITTIIAKTTTQQTQHRLLNQTNRFASFWSFEPSAAAIATATTAGSRRDDHQKRGQGGGSGGEDESQQWMKTTRANKEPQQRERIERLRRDGWMVKKEKHGWKGAEYYESLREVAMGELGGA